MKTKNQRLVTILAVTVALVLMGIAIWLVLMLVFRLMKKEKSYAA